MLRVFILATLKLYDPASDNAAGKDVFDVNGDIK
jgi:hypothetical protein